MGGASSFISMLAIAAFLGLAWSASKVSKMVGISSIVLEITTGVVLGPRVLGLVDPAYTVCETKRTMDCKDPGNLQELIDSGAHLGPTFGKIANKGYCNKADYHGSSGSSSASHGSSADHGWLAPKVDGDVDSTASHGSGSADHGSAASTSEGSAADTQGAPHRRLAGGGNYHSYHECLIKSCEADVSAHCGEFPDFFTLIGHAGVGLMIFESGMHFDFEKAKIVGPWACVVAVLGTILPLVFGTAIVMAFGKPLMPDGISAGTALAPTSVGIALRLLGEAGVLQENFGQAIITAAFVDDILSLVLFNVLFSLGGDFDMFKTVFAPIIGIVFMILACLAAMMFWPWFLEDYLLSKMPDKKEGAKLAPRDQALFFFMFFLLFVYGTITHFLGTHLWGCFIAGMSFACLNPPHHAHHVWVKQTKRMTSWMIRIFFAGTVAFSIPVMELLSIEAFWKGSILGIVACVGTKVFCAPFMGKARFVIGWAMVGRAEFAYLIAQMALAAGMMDQATFSMVIWALLYATIFAPFVFRYLLNRYVAAEGIGGQAQDEHLTDVMADFGHEEGGEMKEFSASDDVDYKKNLQALESKTQSGFQPTEFGSRSPGGELRAANGQVAKQDASGKGGFLCCLFFKKVVVH
eukprot:TRINITY_DN5319_c0_g1_i5.p1 TRINITY_DN5319_c0_g1~~TRINITY_DN5319_c0_g1_i5.p1  ORF type:complete len:635 (+),score=115.96 TRINITY_DN5319_c0_g1_i5:100-2004(+)